jgi:hypothetical protein
MVRFPRRPPLRRKLRRAPQRHRRRRWPLAAAALLALALLWFWLPLEQPAAPPAEPPRASGQGGNAPHGAGDIAKASTAAAQERVAGTRSAAGREIKLSSDLELLVAVTFAPTP